jgi:serine/threonine protein kinase
VIPKSRTQSADDRARVFSECDFLRTHAHPGIIAFYDFFEDISNYYLVMELAENGTLLELVSASRALAEPNARKYLRQIIAALSYLHDTCRVVHRDLKCENLLLDRNSRIRLIDFEFSRSRDSVMQSKCGTPVYMAPEVITDSSYGPEVDIWSTGVILYAIVAGHLPYAEQPVDALVREIMYSDPVTDGPFSEDLRDLLSRMLQTDPKARIGLAEIAAHRWLGADDAQPVYPDTIHAKTIEKLRELKIGPSENETETAAYRIVARCIETDLRGGGSGAGMMPSQEPPCPAPARGSFAKPPLPRLVGSGRFKCASNRSSDLQALRASPVAPKGALRPPMQLLPKRTARSMGY